MTTAFVFLLKTISAGWKFGTTTILHVSYNSSISEFKNEYMLVYIIVFAIVSIVKSGSPRHRMWDRLARKCIFYWNFWCLKCVTVFTKYFYHCSTASIVKYALTLINTVSFLQAEFQFTEGCSRIWTSRDLWNIREVRKKLYLNAKSSNA